jgi:ABC-type transporter Mla subunit MlaD
VTDARAGLIGKKIPRRFQGRMDPIRAGLLALIIVVVGTFLAFSKQLPWKQPFEVRGVFQSAANIRLDSPVRIAGVEIGSVTKVAHEQGSDLTVVTMQVKKHLLHQDSTLKIRPRLFLEGNFFVDATQGTPEAPLLGDGDTIPVTQTAYPVQLDQILTSLQSDNRKDLQDLLKGLGSSLTHRPTAAENVGQDPDVQGETGAQALNQTLKYSAGGLKSASIVNHEFLGTQRHDLRKLVAGLQKLFAALDQNEEQLKDFFTNFNTTMAGLATEQSSLRNAIRLLGPTVQSANEAFGHLAAALPPTREFVRAFIPAVVETPATIAAATPWLRQFTALASQAELGGLLRDLRPMTASFAKLISASIPLYEQTDLASRCFSDVILPAGDTVLQDGPSTIGVPTFKEFWYSLAGLAGESQNFDGNGAYTRVATGGGPNTIKSGKLPGRPIVDQQLYGNALVPPLGTRPPRPTKKPPYKPKFACYKNAKPNLNGPAANAGPPDATISANTSSRNGASP